jgi:energy-coupling factor transporter ATP-binding protein EcfA2
MDGDVPHVVHKLFVEGVTLQAPGPLGSVTIRFTPGVDVLYGLNGAGKSRILDSLLSTLGARYRGVGGIAHLALGTEASWEVHDPTDVFDELPWWQESLMAEATEAATRLEPPASSPWMERSDVDWFTSLVASPTWDRLVQSHLDPDLAARVTWAIVSQGRFALELTGVQEWGLLACARADMASGEDRFLLSAIELALADPNPESTFSGHPEAAEVFERILDWDGAVKQPQALLNHDWAPVPLLHTGMSIAASDSDYGSSLLGVVSESAVPDLNQQSSEDLLRFMETEFLTSHITEPRSDGWLKRVPEEANRVFRNLLTDAPTLKLELRSPHDRSMGAPALHWWVGDPTGARVELEALSTAQRRWSTLAIQLAIAASFEDPAGPDETDRLLVLDEPEAALHATAQRFLAQGIGEIAPDLQVIVASHSAAFLDNSHFRLHHVHRGRSGETQLTHLVGDQLQSAERLGLAPSDLFQHIRLFIVVEGRHDEVILRASIGDQLDGIGAKVVPMGGATQLSPVLDSRLIFDYTDAKVLFVIDNLDTQVAAIWKRALDAANSGESLAGRSTLEELKRDGEQGFLRNFGIRAIEQGQIERVDLFGLAKPDILEYLPPSALVPKASGRDWEQLRAQSGTKTGTAFKKWLREKLDFVDNDAVLAAAASLLDPVPQDFCDLVSKADRIARDPWWR